MNAELLIAHFNRISDAPDAIPRLRRFILDLAVRGKLTEHDPTDEHASELLKRIQSETGPLGKGVKRIVRREELPPVDPQKAPFSLPPGWVWARFPELGVFGRGKSKHRPRNDPTLFEGGKHLLVQTGDVARSDGIIKTFTNRYNDVGLAQSLKWPKGTLCITIAANIADSGILSFDACFPDSVVGFVPASPIPSARYFEYFVRTAKSNLLEFAPATAQKNINLEILNAVLVPVPPLPELCRIVAKVDELMALCDRLEAEQRERETRRNRLTLASNYHLNNGVDANTYLGYGRFYLGNLPALTSQPDQIVRVRQTILSLALRGQLVSQDPNDEPASVLLSKIAQERAKLLDQAYPNPSEARTQLLKQQKQFLPEDLQPLPMGWQWSTLMQCSALVVDCHNKTAPYSNSGVILLRTTNIRDGRLNLNEPKFVNEQTYARWSARCQPEPGDILITREAPMGEVCIVPQGMRICLGQRMMLTRLVPNTLDPHFLLYSLRDHSLMDRVQDKPVGATVQHLRVGGVETLLVAVPPIEEQHRIVAKVDELMALCDRLESQLASAQDETGRLLESVLHHALNRTFAVEHSGFS